MKKRKILAGCLLIPSLLASGCGKDKEKPRRPLSTDKIYLMNETLGEDEYAEPLAKPIGVTSFVEDPTNYINRTGNQQNTETIRILYRKLEFNRDYSNYVGWRIWAWDSGNGGNGNWYEFTKYNDYGVICDIPVSEVAANGTSISKMGIVLTNCNSPTTSWGDATNSYSKDPDSDLFVSVSPTNINGVQLAYCKGKSKTVYYDQNSVFMSSLDYCYYKSPSIIRAVFVTQDSNFLPHKGRFTVKINGEVVNDYLLVNVTSTGKGVDLKFANRVIKASDDVEVSYKISEQNVCVKRSVVSSRYYDSEEFISKYNYSGNDLGVTFDNDETPTKTTFKVWSPVSTKMVLRIYNSSDYRTDTEPIEEKEMILGEKGVFTITLDGDYTGKYYTYVVTNSEGANEVCDPYAKACGLNGRRGMVCNFKALNKTITGWGEDTHPNFGENNVDASISEIHVRDMTINPNSGVSEGNRGKFLGLTEEGTTFTKGEVTVTTGLDHLKELGVTHVQIQPMYDYSSVDETTMDNTYGEDNYNWGYDPLNYNCLEGSYSSDPVDGFVRIKEAKQMIMKMHSNGISINMDVVYNHTSGFLASNFQLLVPNYYYRTDLAGTPSNGSGCGNEMASERFMVNKFIRESCKFWVDEYHIDGFRFDLMGLIDNQTMIDVYNDCKVIYNKIMVYGEPWTGGGTTLKSGNDANKLSEQQTVQSSLAQSYFAGGSVMVGAFNDIIRNAVRGDNNPGKGFVNGSVGSAASILPGIKGKFNGSQSSINPNQVINYVSCHDNYTLNDQLKQTIYGDITYAYKQAEAIIFMSQGVPFIQEGEEFMRTKVKNSIFDHNSYVSGDLVNSMDYSLKVDNIQMFNYFKDLIAFRKNNSFLRMSTRVDINEKLTDVKAVNGLISYKITTEDSIYTFYHAGSSTAVNLSKDNEVVFSTAGKTIGSVLSGDFVLTQNESIVLKESK